MSSCCIPLCRSGRRFNQSPMKDGKNSHISYHMFPKDEKRFKQWIDSIQKYTNHIISNPTLVCSRHFVPSDIKSGKKMKTLKNGAIPVLFAWNQYDISKRNMSPNKKLASPLKPPSTPHHTRPGPSTLDIAQQNAKQLQQQTELEQQLRAKLVEVSLQQSFCLERFSASDDQIRFYTGFSSSRHLQIFWKMIEPETWRCYGTQPASSTSRAGSSDQSTPQSLEPADKSPSTSSPQSPNPADKSPSTSSPQSLEPADKSPSTSSPQSLNPADKSPSTSSPQSLEPADENLSTTPQSLKPAGKKPAHRPVASRCLPLVDEFFLFLVYLSLGLTEMDLAIRFNIHQSTVGRLIKTWGNFLYTVLGAFEIWMPADEVRAKMPSVFAKYSDTQVVVDCTEIKCQNPSSPFLQSEVLSPYKSHSTFKALIGTSPHGAVTFFSPVYSGSVSDTELFKQCGIVRLLDKDMAVMVDESFRIDESVSCKVYRTTFQVRKPKLAHDEVEATQDNARLTVHVERVNRRMKENKFFDRVVPLSISASINQLFAVACLLCNYQDEALIRSWAKELDSFQ